MIDPRSANDSDLPYEIKNPSGVDVPLDEVVTVTERAVELGRASPTGMVRQWWLSPGASATGGKL